MLFKLNLSNKLLVKTWYMPIISYLPLSRMIIMNSYKLLEEVIEFKEKKKMMYLCFIILTKKY